MRKTYKKIIALCAVLIFALALIPVQSFAIADPFTAIAVGGLSGASGGGLFGSMALASGFDVSINSGSDQDLDALWNSLNPDSVYFSGEKGQVTEPDPESQIPTVYDYITINLNDWLQAQTDFIDEFVSNYQVTDNSSGSITLSPTLNGLPVIPSGRTEYYGQLSSAIGSTSSFAGFSFVTMDNSSTYRTVRVTYPNGNTANKSILIEDFPIKFCLSIAQASGFYPNYNEVYSVNMNYYKVPISDGGYSFSSNVPFTFSNGKSGSWTSNAVNTGVFDNWSAAKVKIPANSWSPSDPVNWSVQEMLQELTYKMANSSGDDIIIEDDSGPGPVPPPVPVPTTPLGDIPVDEWYDLFGLPVLEGQEEIHQDLQDFSGQVSDDFDDVIGELDNIESDVESIDTNIGIGNGLLGDLKSIGQSIQSTLSSILSGVTDLVQEIVLSTETFIAGLLNSIMGGLGGWLSTMREAFSIWHYVVEWIGSISTVFSWFWSVAGSTSYYIQLPIYASLAGAVVLAFYKRFGK